MLYNRIVQTGPLEEPSGVPEPQWALPSTINWMEALRLLLDDKQVNYASAAKFYSNISVRKFGSEMEENSVLEQLFFSLHQLSALSAFKSVTCKSDVARMGIVTWYYGIYYAASAMICAQDGSIQENMQALRKLGTGK